MSADLLTDTQLAEHLAIPLDRFHFLRNKYGWPCVKLGRSEWRFTPEQVTEILRLQSTPAGTRRPTVSGLTARSAARSRP